jgi:hypothetical protein
MGLTDSRGRYCPKRPQASDRRLAGECQPLLTRSANLPSSRSVEGLDVIPREVGDSHGMALSAGLRPVKSVDPELGYYFPLTSYGTSPA